MKTRILFLLLALFLFNGQVISQVIHKQYVVVLSMDAFRWDYPEKANTPNLDEIQAKGVRAEALIPAFPSKTFPNHYTLATGLYPDHHGIVQNNFHDEDGRIYKLGDRVSVEDGSFYHGEPIWVTARKQGLKTASYFWVGSEADIQGMHPDYWKLYDHDFPYENRIDTVIHWLTLPEEDRPQLIMWYMDQPDGVGHYEGPDSDKTVEVIEYLDSMVGVFHNKLKELPYYQDINIIILSDHGMGAISPDRHIMLSEKIDTSMVEFVDGGNPCFNLKIKDYYIDEVMACLDTVSHIKAWRTTEIPSRLNYGSNPRTQDITVVADSAWSISYYYQKLSYQGGAHGYDPANKDMHAIFYAIGPQFKYNYQCEPFENVEVYNVISHLLGLEPAQTDGNIENVKSIFYYY